MGGTSTDRSRGFHRVSIKTLRERKDAFITANVHEEQIQESDQTMNRTTNHSKYFSLNNRITRGRRII